MSSSSTFKAVIFDMDGVVADSHPIHKMAWKEFLTEVGRQVSEEDLDFVVEGRRRDEILRFFLGDLTDQQVVDYGQRKDHLFQKASHQVQTLPGVVTLIQEMKRLGLPTALATSAGRPRTQLTLERLKLTTSFDVVVTGEDVELSKPHPAIFLVAAERLGVQPPHVLVVEDSTAGVQAAKAAGMKCLGIALEPGSTRLIDAGADYVCTGFEGLSVAWIEETLATSGLARQDASHEARTF